MDNLMQYLMMGLVSFILLMVVTGLLEAEDKIRKHLEEMENDTDRS